MTRPNESWQIFALALISLLALGCGDDGSSTAPVVETDPVETFWVDFTIVRFECIVDGDAIEGAGEFHFRAQVGSRSKTWRRELHSGESSTLNWSDSFGENYEGAPHEVAVEFLCAENDVTIGGVVFNDPDMDARRITAIETIDVGEQITNRITMGNDKCKVRLHYVLKARLEVEEL